MKTHKPPVNNLKALCEEKGWTARSLAKWIGTSAPHMSRLINGQSPLTIKWLLKLSAAFKVPTSDIVGVHMEKKFKDSCDDTLLGSIMGWLLEAADDQKTKLDRKELARLTSFIYKESVEQPLSFGETRYLAFTALKLKNVLNG